MSMNLPQLVLALLLPLRRFIQAIIRESFSQLSWQLFSTTDRHFGAWRRIPKNHYEVLLADLRPATRTLYWSVLTEIDCLCKEKGIVLWTAEDVDKQPSGS